MPEVQFLSPEVINQIRESSNEAAFAIRKLTGWGDWTGIAEGDSWFDYPPSYLEDPKKGDLINQLNLKPNAQGNRKMFNILRIAQAGDTLENMVYGTEVDDNFLPEKSQFEKALRLIDKYQPDFFLFSGGGNDIAATELVTFLNHAESKLGSRRESQINYVVNEVFREIFAYLFEQVLLLKPDLHIFTHGYGHPIPDGRPVARIADYNFFGPWLLPTFAKKRINDLNESKQIMKELIDAFNEMLIDLTQQESFKEQVHHLDLRTLIQSDLSNYQEDWENELHLTVRGYEKVANKFSEVIIQEISRNR